MFRTTISKLNPATIFSIGLSLVLLALLLSFPPAWNTFIHGWKVELAASVLLLAASAYAALKTSTSISLHKTEAYFILLPMTLFIVWSGLSAFWAASPISAAHHTFTWSLYLAFFLFVRILLNEAGSSQKLTTAVLFPLLLFATIAVTGFLTLQIVGSGQPLGMIYSKYGEQINTIFPLILAATIVSTGRRFVLGTICLLLLWLLIFASSSRAAIGLFAFGTLICGILVILKGNSGSVKRLATVAAVLIFAPVLLSLPGLLGSETQAPTVARFTDSKQLDNSNDFRKLMVTLSTRMFSQNPVTGVGADNFGIVVHNFRNTYAAEHPEDLNLAQGETTIPERAHNEYLQIAAELGVVGSLIFLWFITGIGLLAIDALRQYRKLPIYAFAALIGIALFLASSLVTSYSFRLIQNGLVFFLVLAIAIRGVYGKQRKSSSTGKVTISPVQVRRLALISAVVCLLFIASTSIRTASVAYHTQANYTANIDDAILLYERSMSLDPDDPHPHYWLGMRYFQIGKYSEAVPYLKGSIRLGKTPSADYSYLASAQSLSGDNNGAEQTLAEAAKFYPHSSFVRTRYAWMLNNNGRSAEAENQLKIARSISESDTNGWWALMNNGPRIASDLAFQTKNHTQVMDLMPEDAMRAVVAERDIRFPDERVKLPF